MTINTFARDWRLKTRLDACGDKIIPGKRGHLYFDGDELCLMVTDGKRATRSRWKALGGKLWMGDISGGVQDVSIKGIPLSNARAAIRMCRIPVRRIPSAENLERLERMRGLKAARGLVKATFPPNHGDEAGSGAS